MSRSLSLPRPAALSRPALAVLAALAFVLVPGLARAEGSATEAFQQALARGPAVAALTAFVGGLLVSLTPCVYPMIALTVSVFGASEARSRAHAAALSGTFVLGMALLFTVLGVTAGLSGNLFGSMLANRWVVVGLAVVFLAMAASMFGAFELTLPSALNNRLASVGGIGFGGAFTLGMVSAIVAAPCTGPVLTGMLVWIATTKQVLLGSGMMFAFSLGLGLPFFLVGAFAVSLPKGGAWMLGVKWFFGVTMSVLALYFLRNSFPVLGRLMKPETGYLVAAVVLSVIGLATAAVHLKAEQRRSPIAHLSRPFKLASIPFAIVGAFAVVTWMQLPKGRLEWLHSEAEARKVAIEQHRPVIVDFGAEWCVACKELDLHTFSQPNVQKEAGRFVAVKVDATDDENADVAAVKGRYRVVGLPTVVVLDSNGVERVRFNEFVPADRFLEAIRAVD